MPYQNLLSAVVNGIVIELNALILGDTLRFQVRVNGVSIGEYDTFKQAFSHYISIS
jgi:hypothetical protein